jgi:NAD(P)H-flavin reductase
VAEAECRLLTLLTGPSAKSGYSTPLYQILTHALGDKSNETKFKLLFSNVSKKDILLREELDALQKKYPQNLDIVYLVDKADGEWNGELGQHLLSPFDPICSLSLR